MCIRDRVESFFTGANVKGLAIICGAISGGLEVIDVENSYTKEELIERIKEATNVNQERAEVVFNLILQAGAIEPTLGDRYYLTGSTPF